MQSNCLRRACYKAAKAHWFGHVVIIMIVASSLKLVIDTYLDANDTTSLKFIIFNYFDLLMTLGFLCEALTKIIAYGFIMDKGSYLRDAWNKLDFTIVVFGLLDIALTGVDMSFIKVIRMLRILRQLRFISHNVSMKTVVIALMESVSGILNVGIVIVLVWIMFAILGVLLKFHL